MPDPKLDQVMLDVKKAAEVSKGATADLTEQLKNAEALKDIFSSIDSTQRKMLATELEMDEALSRSKKSVSETKDALDKVPSVLKAAQAIQEKTGKSYQDALETLKKAAEETKKHTAANKALLSAIKSVEGSYKKVSEEIGKQVKTSKEINKELQIKRKNLQDIKKLASEVGAQFKLVFGAAGAAGPEGALKSMVGTASAFGRFGTEKLKGYTERRRERELEKTGEISKITGALTGILKGIPAVGEFIGGTANALIESMMYDYKRRLQQRVFSARAGALGAPGGISVMASSQLTREEFTQYGETAFRKGIIGRTKEEAEEEIKGYALISKTYGEDIASAFTSSIIQSSNSVRDTWKIVEQTMSQFRETAKQAGIPLQDIAKWIGDSAVQARYLGVDMETVARVTQGLLKNQELLFRAGITKQNIGKVSADIIGGRAQQGMAVSAFWANQIGLKGSLTQQMEQYMLGGKYFKEREGGGYSLEESGITGRDITLRTIREFQKLILSGPAGFQKGMAAMQAGIAPIKDMETLRTLMLTPAEKLDELVPAIQQEMKPPDEKLGQLVKFELITQKWQDRVATLLVQLAKGEATPEKALQAYRESKNVLKDIIGMEEGGKKHIGGVIKRGTVSEVLTSESMKSLGRDSFYAFNPSHDIQIGSPQTTKNAMNRVSGGMGTSDKKIEITLNINGSILTDNTFLNKIEEVFARRMGLIGG